MRGALPRGGLGWTCPAHCTSGRFWDSCRSDEFTGVIGAGQPWRLSLPQTLISKWRPADLPTIAHNFPLRSGTADRPTLIHRPLASFRSLPTPIFRCADTPWWPINYVLFSLCDASSSRSLSLPSIVVQSNSIVVITCIANGFFLFDVPIDRRPKLLRHLTRIVVHIQREEKDFS